MEKVVLVDQQDNEIGTMEKIQAHVEGRLHRAISVFIFNSDKELLLQQRADGKYHSAGLWTNTCCSHPMPGETNLDAATRRLFQEMGLRCQLNEIFSFVYKAQLDNHLTEHEYDHVFTGITDVPPSPDAAEASGWKYLSANAIRREVTAHPENYTEWFKICITDYEKKIFI